LGERIGREWVLPLFILSIAAVACLLTYPYATLAIASLGYLAALPWTWRRFRTLEQLNAAPAAGAPSASPAAPAEPASAPDAAQTATPRLVEIRTNDQKR